MGGHVSDSGDTCPLRRFNVIAGHLSPSLCATSSGRVSELAKNCTSAGRNVEVDERAESAQKFPYASASGQLSSYGRVHGNVSQEPATWQSAEVLGPLLQDVLYEKAVGEGIAKVILAGRE